MMWRYYGDAYPGAWGWGMMLGMVLWWALIIAALVFFVRWLVRREGVRLGGGVPGPLAAGEEEPLAIAKRRYARGEITREQYEELRETLLH